MNTLVAVIDDDEVVRASTRALLERLGYEVRDCPATGDRHTPNGLIDHLRKGTRMPAVIICDPEIGPRVKQLGTKVIYKPMSDDDLIACMKSMWSKRG